jgi:hypothetical protein
MQYEQRLASWTTELLTDATFELVDKLRKRLPAVVPFPADEAREMRLAVAKFLAEQLTEHRAEFLALCETRPKFNKERFRAAFAKLLDRIVPQEHFRARFVVPGFSPN